MAFGPIRVTRGDIYLTEIPVNSVRHHGSGAVASSRNVLLRLETSDGIIGWGEAAPWSVFTGTAEGCASALSRYIVPTLKGVDATAVSACMDTANHTVVGHPEAKAAFESALLDIIGKANGVPVHALLGGACRTEIPLSVSLADADMAVELEFARRMFADGIRIFKLKTGFAEHGQDLKRLEQLRKHLPEASLRVDYNQGMLPYEAIRRLRDVEAFNVDFIEQPVPGKDIAAMAAITAALDTPVLADESAFDLVQVVEVIKRQAADLISIKIMKCGGLRQGTQIAAVAAAAGITCYGGDMFETGIAHAAGTHMIAASPNVSLGCEFYHATYYIKEDVLTTPFAAQNGVVKVPQGPGLGYEVDEGKVKKYTVQHEGVSL
jgi:muconate cycloisomerase